MDGNVRSHYLAGCVPHTGVMNKSFSDDILPVLAHHPELAQQIEWEGELIGLGHSRGDGGSPLPQKTTSLLAPNQRMREQRWIDWKSLWNTPTFGLS